MALPSDDVVFAIAALLAAVSLVYPWVILLSFGILLLPTLRSLSSKSERSQSEIEEDLDETHTNCTAPVTVANVPSKSAAPSAPSGRKPPRNFSSGVTTVAQQSSAPVGHPTFKLVSVQREALYSG